MTDFPPPPPQPGPPPAPPGMYLASDGRYYPVQDAPAVQPPPCQPPPMQPPPVKKGGGGKVVLIVAGVLFALCALGGTITALAIAAQTDEADEAEVAIVTSTTVSGSPATTSGGTARTATTRPQTTKAGFGDVAITACGLPNNDFLGPEATVKITNSSSKPSNYLVELGFLSADGATQYDTSNAIVSQLAPGQSSEQKATSVDRDVRAKVAASGLVCKVLDVTRFAA